MSDQDDERAAFHWELLKLLLQVAWADDVVHPAERYVVLHFALRFGVSDEQIAELERHLDGSAPVSLPPPNFALLRRRKEEAMDAAQQLVIADDEIRDAENELLAELHVLLSEGESS